jgi:hypothetical protein
MDAYAIGLVPRLIITAEPQGMEPELARIMDVLLAINARRRRNQPSSAEECQAFNKVAYAHIQITPPTEAT